MVNRVGYWSALVAFLVGAGFAIAQLLQLIGLLTPPWDGILIYGFSLLIAAPFMVALVALHYDTPPARRLWSHAALLMSVIYVTYVTLNYVVQLAEVIPRLTTQASLDVSGSTSRTWVRRFFLANARVTPVIALVYFLPTFSIPLLLLGSPWIITAPGSFLLPALMFKRQGQSPRS